MKYEAVKFGLKWYVSIFDDWSKRFIYVKLDQFFVYIDKPDQAAKFDTRDDAIGFIKNILEMKRV